jgi:hypothetical protein
MVDITRKDLAKQYPVYTKAGKIWKNRINWSEVLKPGTVISTNFGIFTFVSTYKENKVWYIILSDGVNNYTVKRQQARKNKKLPKTTVIQKVVYLARIDILESLLDQAEKRIKRYNKEHMAKYGTRGKIGIDRTLCDTFPFTINTILSVGYIDDHLFNKFKRQLINYYHPDKGNVKGAWELTVIAEKADLVKRVRGVL